MQIIMVTFAALKVLISKEKASFSYVWQIQQEERFLSR
ncbi:hypothetical protein EVA_08468 [gut metagenome]|uniref:Uncharacterized protein n=1 Tax=gut metagenome TaxID=749906 RepID=J9GT05_9ZZZZ